MAPPVRLHWPSTLLSELIFALQVAPAVAVAVASGLSEVASTVFSVSPEGTERITTMILRKGPRCCGPMMRTASTCTPVGTGVELSGIAAGGFSGFSVLVATKQFTVVINFLSVADSEVV